MTSLNNKYTNNRSMNGLINIYADNIETTNSTVNDTLIVDGKDINTVANQVDTNKINLTGITYTATPTPTTNISNKLIVSSIDATNTSVFRANLNVLGTGTIFGTMQVDSTININGNFNSFGTTNKFNNDLEVSKVLYVGKNSTTQISSIDLNGTMYIREPSNPNALYMSIKYEPTLAGWRFMNEQANGFMYFSVKNSAGVIRNFQFSNSQLYSNINSYYDCEINVSFNKQFTLGDTNFTGTWIGSRIIYVPSTQPHDGLKIYNKGLNNNTAYYTNFTHNNLSNVEVQTFRMNHNNIWSKVPHTMESTLTLSGNLIANSINITPVELSYLSGTSSNIQTALNNKLDLTGGTISGNLTISGTTTLNAQVDLNDVLFVNSTTITPTQISYLAGTSSNLQSQLNGKLNSLGTILSGSLTFADNTIQSTAYTTADDTKLQAIGTITTATLNANFSLTTNVIYSAGSMSLSAGTYIITVNTGVSIIGGTNLVGQMTSGYSTSSTAFSQNINLAIYYSGITGNIGNQWTLNSSNIISVSSTTTYYLLIQCNFGTAGRLQYNQSLSAFRAVRIA